MSRRSELAVFVLVCAGVLAASPRLHSQSDLTANESTAAPGMQKTTGEKAKSASGSITAGLTPAATGRLYPADGALLIGQGDLLHIEVFDTPEFLQDDRVDTSGNIQVNGLGVVHVENMKETDVSALIESRLKNENIMLAPKVTVQITDFISHGVAINGEVRAPGIYPILGPRRLSDLLVAAGGVTELSDGVMDIRRPGDPTPQRIFIPKDANKTMIVPGDTLEIERAPLVYILGNVRRPGGFPLARPTSLIQALSLANGFSPSAQDKRSILFRQNQDGTRVEMEVNLREILRGKSGDIALRGGDILFVPNSAIKDIGKAALAVLPSLAVATVYELPNL